MADQFSQKAALGAQQAPGTVDWALVKPKPLCPDFIARETAKEDLTAWRGQGAFDDEGENVAGNVATKTAL